ncbi:MAG TPA: isocitrate/isopropylmalate family dehydrogenase [Candidatus Angelobacter sp.]|jgi:isocitrate dehydrogenase (NAD+)|nr:isocitrate/isopropylmalate family dehydrogenase [Candidatus Angelobacter sp.]
MPTIAVLEGDQTGQELLDQALRVLDPAVIGVELELRRFDLSLAHRRATANQVVRDAADAMRECGLGLKAATITPEVAGDVGSPNAILRERVGGKVIVRTGRRIPGVPPVAGVNAPISVVRMAVDDAYGAREWRESADGDELAFRTEKVSRATCRAVAEFAFVQAGRMRGRVFGGPKYTVSPIYEGMLKEEMDAAAARHPQVPYEPQLIDATYALLLSRGSEQPLVIPALNRDGDCLSDLVLQLFGSIAGAESILIGFEGDESEPHVVMAEAPHGTAPALQGKNIANPMAMILAAASLLSFVRDAQCRVASRAIYESVFEAVREGVRTADLGGHAFTDEFTGAIVDRVRGKLEVWESLGVD